MKQSGAIPLTVGTILLILTSLPAWAQGGDTLFKAKCGACHGATGTGDTGIGKANKLRDLGSAEVQKQSDDELTTVITNGKNKMPAYGKRLKPEQIKDAVGYIRSLKKS